MSEKKEYKKTEGRGNMWNNDNVAVSWKGSALLQNQDSYFTIVKTIIGGEPKFELLQSCGLLHLKDATAKETAPDIGGTVTVRMPDGTLQKMKFGGWEEVGQSSGNVYLSIGLQEKQEDVAAEPANTDPSDWKSSTIPPKPVHEAQPEIDDEEDIPF